VRAKRCISRAFTLVEILLVIAVLGAIGALSYNSSTGFRAASDASKLQSDVAAVNRAIDLYRASGGVIPPDATADVVLAKLKTRADSASAATTIGSTGSFLDVRTVAVWQSSPEATSSQLRAFWDASAMAFKTAASGSAGIKEFQINPELASAEVTTEPRPQNLKAATEAKWVWDYGTPTVATAVAGAMPKVGVVSAVLQVAASQLIDSWVVTDPNGTVNVSYIFREAGYNSRLGLFSLEDMGPDKYDLETNSGRTAFMKEAIRRVLDADKTGRGKVIIDASQSSVGFGKQYNFRPGDVVAAILIPNTSFENSLTQLNAGTTNSQTAPLLSFKTSSNNADDGSQIASLGNSAFAIEDIPGAASDTDFNDLIFQAFGLEQPEGTTTAEIDPLTYYVNQQYWDTPNPSIGISIKDALIQAGVIPPGS